MSEKYSFPQTPAAEPEKELTAEEKQEAFDKEIEKEAEKLEVSIEELTQEINKLGGPEKFKETMESRRFHISSNAQLAGVDVYKGYVVTEPELVTDSIPPDSHTLGERISMLRYNEARHLESVKKTNVISAVTLSALAVTLDRIGNYTDVGSGFREMMEKVSEGESGVNDYFYPGVAAVAVGFALFNIVRAIKMKIAANKERRELDKHFLKMKMTGVGSGK